MRARGHWLAVVLMLLTAAGCGNNGPSSEPVQTPPEIAPTIAPLGPRPQTLPLDNIDPCALLTSSQVNALHVRRGRPGVDNDGLGSRDCLWSNSPDEPDLGWVARATLRRGAEQYRNDSTEVVHIGGFPAVQASSEIQDPETHCLLMIDVAPGQSLWVQFVNMGRTYPGMNHQRACQFARQTAEDMLTNLRGLAR
ncbi:hypothetical protein GCM10023321_85490 [Pseudonocardia eucalypti]|uniref:DUF3558 domain-containing protein n=2 Tax=Pseudonocardia eucalypti TaxID=648755 RepID=A0ABP9RG64_9PSEU